MEPLGIAHSVFRKCATPRALPDFQTVQAMIEQNILYLNDTLKQAGVECQFKGHAYDSTYYIERSDKNARYSNMKGPVYITKDSSSYTISHSAGLVEKRGIGQTRLDDEIGYLFYVLMEREEETALAEYLRKQDVVKCINSAESRNHGLILP